jgi:hypothetical protein
MRPVAFPLAFALLSLGFAPAPFPKAERPSPRESPLATSSRAASLTSCQRS